MPDNSNKKNSDSLFIKNTALFGPLGTLAAALRSRSGEKAGSEKTSPAHSRTPEKQSASQTDAAKPANQCSRNASAAHTSQDAETMKNKWKQLQAGDNFTFGSYVPEDLANTGLKKLPITWQVLAKEDERMLVLARNVLDLQPFHRDEHPIRWEDSDLRRWLNSAFLNAAFSREEQQLICCPEEIEDPLGAELWRMLGMETATASISDRIFLLSRADIMTHFPGEYPFFPGAEAEATEYVERLGDWQQCWWLRTSMSEYAAAMIVSPCASIGFSMIRKDNCQGIRPAMWVSL